MESVAGNPSYTKKRGPPDFRTNTPSTTVKPNNPPPARVFARSLKKETKKRKQLRPRQVIFLHLTYVIFPLVPSVLPKTSPFCSLFTSSRFLVLAVAAVVGCLGLGGVVD